MLSAQREKAGTKDAREIEKTGINTNSSIVNLTVYYFIKLKRQKRDVLF
jgi:hypothetical protein